MMKGEPDDELPSVVLVIKAATSALSLYGTRIPTAIAPRMKKKPNRKKIVWKAFFTYVRGCFTSAAIRVTYSGPTVVKLAIQNAPRKPSNRPKSPLLAYSAIGPGSLQLRNPNASCQGFPPTMDTKVNENKIIINSILLLEPQNSASP